MRWQVYYFQNEKCIIFHSILSSMIIIDVNQAKHKVHKKEQNYAENHFQ